MRFLYAKFKGYIGFYNGCYGLQELEIDFTKCKHNIILIHGINGSGKSTLLNALSVFPDPSTAFMPNYDGEKRLILFNEGDTYNILISSPADNKGGRKQSKAYISKNGLELNPNGNITSYKETIFNEFELDSNYISLSKLSSEDRGLGDKSPAERKKFVSKIIENLEVYNEIYKTLNKKSLILKSHVNMIHTKIQNTGNKDQLQATLNSIRVKESNIQNEITRLNNLIVAIQAKSSVDEEEAKRIDNLYKEIEDLKSHIQDLQNQINTYHNRTKIRQEDISGKYSEDSGLMIEYRSKIEELNNVWNEKIRRMNSIESSINSMKVELSSISGDIDKTIEAKYDESNNRLSRYEEELSINNIVYSQDIILKIHKILDIYSTFISRLDKIYEIATVDELQYLISNDTDRLSRLTREREDIVLLINNTKDAISRQEEISNMINTLSKRHPQCRFDDCEFVKEALLLRDDQDDKAIEQFNIILQTNTRRLEELDREIEEVNRWNLDKVQFDIMIQDIISNISLFESIGLRSMSNIDNILKMISNINPFNDIRNPKYLMELLVLLEEYKDEVELNKSLRYQHESLTDKIKLINTTRNMISTQEKELEDLSKESSSTKDSIDRYNSLVASLSKILEQESSYNELYTQFTQLSEKMNTLQNQLDEYNKRSAKLLEEVGKIQEYNTRIENLNKEYQPLYSMDNEISAKLLLLDSYYNEYNEYNEKYNYIETIKKYCSPTSGGIQTIFMQLYMSKLLTLSNQVLTMLFNGEYSLLDFVINENEFRIPFCGSGLPVDDISSGSRSQICMMSMVINLVLLYQASTKYNIARLDEIDDGLDVRNKMEFLNVLNHIIQILNIEQLIIVSHSIEADTSNVDIIKLKTYQDFEDVMSTGNIIYDYSEEIKKTIS